ncbi:acetyl-CoA carboxylase carboxyltransferase subunit alpha/beta [Streptomyces meridianus]|uniref:Acetyl-CoA carboxylase carboxyltransferase subunit alpha/beta n=1 Tax=Streptomyces meridianus TaxID=2938945 RepID=A0ABT0X307_9ACTN|nr:acetyl-CoA carboxylase carboxyltransferase subunit alpha/beta [Streptomyces meridianus]MCM2576590.1 acetyl-CoA carboxylase carboxyltransferase subunit alpha/beta [Streptomyces meridianus]
MTGSGHRAPVLQLIDTVADPGSWIGWDEPVEPGGTSSPGAAAATSDPDYAADLAKARESTGLDESVVTGEARIGGRRVAVVACEFRFLAGSIGLTAGERLVRAVERATAQRLPLLAAPASGGTRMQEGTVAFVQMIKVTAAIAEHKAAGLPYLVHLRHPTTGGVLASWGSLGHLTSAEPEALIGFLGPRVHEALYGEPFPSGVQVAENLLAHGLVDAVLTSGELPAVLARALDVLCPAPAPDHRTAVPAPWQECRPGAPVPSTADSIRRSRRPERPGVRDLLQVAGTSVTLFNGTGAGEHDPGLCLALARIGGAPCVVLGHDRRGAHAPPLGPGGLREARRGMRLAAELGLPLLTVVDTAGAALSREAEEGGLAAEIARCLADLVTLPAPTLCLLLGQGAGGGALALLPADRVLAARHAWLSPLPPEGASAILHRTTERAFEVAGGQGVRSADLLEQGIVDRVVEEADGDLDAADRPEEFLTRLGRLVGAELDALRGQPSGTRLVARRLKHRRLGLG